MAAEIGTPDTPAYGASKAYVSRYLEGLRYRSGGDVVVTDVRAGYVDTPMTPKADRFRECSPETAARGIIRAVDGERDVTYVLRRWWLVSKLLAVLLDRYRAELA